MPASRRLFDGDDSAGLVFGSKKLADSEMDITPMIDCVFQLLIFFMVASNLSGETLEIPVARYGVGVDTNRAAIFVVRAGSSGTPPRIIDSDGSPIDLEGVRRRVAQQKSQGMNEVVIKAERTVPHGFVQQVTRAVMETEGVQFYIGVQDK